MTTRALEPRHCLTGTEPGLDCYNTGLAPCIGRSGCGKFYIVGTELAVQDAYNSLRRGASPRVIHAQRDGRWFPVHVYRTAAPAWAAYDAANERARAIVREEIAATEARQNEIGEAETLEDTLNALLR